MLSIQKNLKMHFKGTFCAASRRFFATFILAPHKENSDEQIPPERFRT